MQFTIKQENKSSIDLCPITSCWKPDIGTRGPWWLRTDRHAKTKCKTPISRAIRRSKTPSSVVNGEESKRDLSTVKGSVGNEPAIGEVKMWPENNLNSNQSHSNISYCSKRTYVSDVHASTHIFFCIRGKTCFNKSSSSHKHQRSLLAKPLVYLQGTEQIKFFLWTSKIIAHKALSLSTRISTNGGNLYQLFMPEAS